MARVWEDAGRARRAFVDMIDGLSDEQMAAESLCTGWSTRMVLGHLTSFVDIPLPKFMFNVARSGFDFDKASTRMAHRMCERSDAELLAALRDKATQPAPVPSFDEGITIADTTIHTQDVRRPLGLEGAPEADIMQRSLEFMTGHKQGKILTGRTYEGLRLQPSDLDWSWGDGQVVEGPAEAMMLAMAGRPTHDELSGPGVDLLR